MNAAQQIHHVLGVAQADAESGNPYRPSYTKSGPGRRHDNKRAERTLKQKNAGAFGRGLRNWINRKQAVEQANKSARRMTSGA